MAIGHARSHFVQGKNLSDDETVVVIACNRARIRLPLIGGKSGCALGWVAYRDEIPAPLTEDAGAERRDGAGELRGARCGERGMGERRSGKTKRASCSARRRMWRGKAPTEKRGIESRYHSSRMKRRAVMKLMRKGGSFAIFATRSM